MKSRGAAEAVAFGWAVACGAGGVAWLTNWNACVVITGHACACVAAIVSKHNNGITGCAECVCSRATHT